MAAIELSNITKSYGKEVAVKKLTLAVNAGEFLTILGPSGCGKTTTLRIIAGLEEPDRGEVILDQRLVFSREQGVLVPPENRDLGLIFQSYALWPHMTVKHNISLGLEEKKLRQTEIQRLSSMALEKVHLQGYGDRYPSELSGGQQQRVAVARLIAMQPSILLMDEPLSNLDAMLRVEMRSELKRMHSDLQATTVYVTHDQIEALTLSDRIVVMDNGVVEQTGKPFEIYYRPETLFVAEFVGNPKINRLDAQLLQDNGHLRIDFGEFSLPLRRNVGTGNRNVVATVRPESIEVSKAEREGWLKMQLNTVQPTGSETILQTSSERLRLTLLQPGFFDLPLNSPLWVWFDTEVMNLYDPETGRNLLLAE